jgi:hypothetical protein
MVSMKSVIGSAKFQEAEMELPIALEKQFLTKHLLIWPKCRTY